MIVKKDSFPQRNHFPQNNQDNKADPFKLNDLDHMGQYFLHDNGNIFGIDQQYLVDKSIVGLERRFNNELIFYHLA